MSAEILASGRLEGTGLSPVVLHTVGFQVQHTKEKKEGRVFSCC